MYSIAPPAEEGADTTKVPTGGNKVVSLTVIEVAPAANVDAKKVLDANVFVSYRAGILPDRM